MRKMAYRLEDVVRFTYIDAPHEVAPNPKIPPELLPPRPLGWWRPEKLADRRWNYHGVDASLAAIANAQAAELNDYRAGFDGILGFSQGTALAHLVLALREYDIGACPAPSLSFGAFFGGFPYSPEAPVFAAATRTLAIPSLHVCGAHDTIVQPSRSALLEDRFEAHERVNYQHPAGHVVHSSDESLAIYEE